MSDQMNSEAVQKEQFGSRKVKKAFEQDHGLNEAGIMNAAYAPNFYGKGSVSEIAKERLNKILAGPPDKPDKKKKYQFGQPESTEGLEYKRILQGEEP